MSRRSQRGRSSGRSLSQNSIGDYEVGYGRPPEHSRFQPGQSGNPKGRPKRPSLDDIVARLADQRMSVNVDGKAQKLSGAEVLLRRAYALAMKDNPRYLEIMLELFENHYRQRLVKPAPTHMLLEVVPTKFLDPNMSDKDMEAYLEDYRDNMPAADFETFKKYFVRSEAFGPRSQD